MLRGDTLDVPLKKTRWLGHRLHYYSEVVSTNHIAKELASNGAPAGTVVLADRQTGGEGRLGRRWVSQDGGLWFTTIIKPKLKLEDIPQVTLVASVAIAEAIEKATMQNPGIKWPNDLLINGRKVCGILTEFVPGGDDSDSVIIGIGINVNISTEAMGQELEMIATSLSVEAQREFEKNELFYECLFSLEKWVSIWEQEDFASVKEEWKMRNITLGQTVKVTSESEVYLGQAIDMDNQGRLQIQNQQGKTLVFNHGEVTLRPL